MLSHRSKIRQHLLAGQSTSRFSEATNARASRVKIPSARRQGPTCTVRQKLAARPPAGTSGKPRSTSHCEASCRRSGPSVSRPHLPLAFWKKPARTKPTREHCGRPPA